MFETTRNHTSFEMLSKAIEEQTSGSIEDHLIGVFRKTLIQTPIVKVEAIFPLGEHAEFDTDHQYEITVTKNRIDTVYKVNNIKQVMNAVKMAYAKES